MWQAVGAWALARLAEPSTWAGIAAIVGSMGFLPNATDVAHALPTIGAGVAGVVAIVRAEAGNRVPVGRQ